VADQGVANGVDGRVGRPPEEPASLRAAVRADLSRSGLLGRVALLGVCAWLAYEWGPGNETFTPWILTRVVSTSDGWTAIVATAAVGFAFTSLQQLASGLTALAGFAMFHQTAAGSWRTLERRRNSLAVSWTAASRSRRALTVFTLGTTAVALAATMTTGVTGVRRNWRVVTTSALLCGALVGALGLVVAALVVLAERAPALDGPVQGTLRVLGNPLCWLALAAVLLVAPLARREVGR
jgi:hypothetical protein